MTASAMRVALWRQELEGAAADLRERQAVIAYAAAQLARRLRLADVSEAYRRRVRLRGRGTRKGVGLALAYFRRWRLLNPSRFGVRT